MSDKSPSAAMTAAIERARAQLFPARMEKWLALGFIAFLAGLGEGGGSYSFRWPFPSGSGSGPFGKSTTPDRSFTEIWREGLVWIQDHFGLVLGLAGGLLLVGLGLGLLLSWLSSRGKLLFVESVIHDRYQVKEPWQRLREPAWSVFKFRVALALLVFLSLLIAFGVGGLIALDELKTGEFGAKSLAGGLAMGAILSVTLFPLGLVSMLLDDFVIPVFYLRGGTLGSAWSTVRAEVLAQNAGPVLLFYLLKFVLGVGFVLLATLTACLTCCVAALPYLSSVALLPAHVFFRSYSLYFLEELGIAVFPPKPSTPEWPNYPQRFGA
jgi:hypothetical protein